MLPYFMVRWVFSSARLPLIIVHAPRWEQFEAAFVEPSDDLSSCCEFSGAFYENVVESFNWFTISPKYELWVVSCGLWTIFMFLAAINYDFFFGLCLKESVFGIMKVRMKVMGTSFRVLTQIENGPRNFLSKKLSRNSFKIYTATPP